MIVRINRFFSDLNNTLGCMEIEGLEYPIYTCELPWKFNQQDVSCIPVGVYKVVQHKSPRFGECYKILDVPNRTDVLIHKGNTHKDTHGCILVGLQAGCLNKEEAVLRSGDAFKVLKSILPKEFELRIK